MVSLYTQQTIKYVRVAPAAIWALDYCLTFEHEVRLFTSTGRWSIATVMFILSRYSPIAWIVGEIYVTLVLQSAEACLLTYRIAASSLVLIMVTAEGLLLMRTLALWYASGNLMIRRFLLASYFFVVISMVSCIGIALSQVESVCVPTLESQSSIEEATEVQRLIMGLFVSAALFELTVIVLTLYHSMRLRCIGMHTVSKLASTLSKGSLLYALSLLAISIANIVSFSFPVHSFHGGQSGIIDVFQGILHGVMASRILFDLRDADWSEEHNFQFNSSTTSSHMQFALPMTFLHEDRNV